MISQNSNKLICSLHKKKFRTKYGKFIIEGARAIDYALNNNGAFSIIVYTRAFLNKNPKIIEKIKTFNSSIIYEKALSRSKSLQDNAGVAESLRKQGQLLRKNKDYETALAKFGEALSISTVMNDKSSMAKTYNSMAILNFRTDAKDDALKNWLHALAIVEELGDKPKISKYLNNI